MGCSWSRNLSLLVIAVQVPCYTLSATLRDRSCSPNADRGGLLFGKDCYDGQSLSRVVDTSRLECYALVPTTDISYSSLVLLPTITAAAAASTSGSRP